MKPIRTSDPYRSPALYRRSPRRSLSAFLSCSLLLLLSLCSLSILALYAMIPVKTTVLFLGIDYAPRKSFAGRSDTIVLLHFNTLRPYVGFLSIPRDLWVTIPGYGENRINTAHFFAESQQKGSGPFATIRTIEANFGIRPDYYLRIRFDGVKEIVNAMGGVTIRLEKPMAGYPPGTHHLTGEKALGFARRRQGADDFFRMEQGQVLIKSILFDLIKPSNWYKIPLVVTTASKVIDTNLPFWQYPRLALLVLRVGVENIDSRLIDRSMTLPYTTDQGASVLLPRWELIRPLIAEIFNSIE
ncbi:MAG: LCP family protein [Anaerolineales bacterium]|nr:LCP family protein [Anaerolineales bacterium]MDW8448134.1 LCP family protein [Anaerolineales bacterium]